MKKVLSLIFSALILITALAGCGEEKKEEKKTDPGTSIDDRASDTVRGFGGKISKKWDDVRKDYTSLENDAEAEVGAMNTVSRADVENIVKEMKSDLRDLEDGINDDNEEKAKEVYKDAHKLQIMAKKGDVEAAKEFEDLARNSKALVKQYYGVADDDYDTVKESVDKGINKIENFTDDIWNAFVDLFK